MPLQVDSTTLGINLHMLIGAFILLIVSSGLFLAIWTALRIWRTEKKEKQSWDRFCEQRLAPDLQPYPPSYPGICEGCGKSNSKIYHPESGPARCPVCYESSCLQIQNQTV